MSKILRKAAKIFGLSSGLNQISQYGSLKAGSPNFSVDPDVIQGLSNYDEGWFSAVLGSNSPAMEDMNALCFLYAYQIAYLLQQGVPEWDANTTYFVGSFVSSNSNVYVSLQNNNLNNPVSSVSNWILFSQTNGSPKITEQLYRNVTTLTSGEAITANSAVSLVLIGGEYKVVNANSSVQNRNSSYVGFAMNTVASAGMNVDICMFGPMEGFSGLSIGSVYYLGPTNGTIINTLPVSPVYVGQAISSDTLLVSPNRFQYILDTAGAFIRSHGSSAAAGAGAVYSSGTQDVEHYDFASWSSGTSSTNGVLSYVGLGDSSYNGTHHVLDGLNASAAVTALFQSYNKVSWTVLSNRSTALGGSGISSFNGFLYAGGGNDGAMAVGNLSKYNGSWSNLSNLPTNFVENPGAFVQGGLLRFCGGSNTTAHQTVSMSDTLASSTAVPTGLDYSGCSSPSSNGFISCSRDNSGNTSTISYQWNGSWSSSIAVTACSLGAMAFSSVSQTSFINGGANTNTTVTNGSQEFNGVSVSSAASSANNRISSASSSI